MSASSRSLGMPFCVDLHAADIDAMLGIDNSLRQIGKGRLAIVEEQPLPAVIQGPGPGHEIASHRLPARLNAGDALQKPFRDPVSRLRQACLDKAYVFKGCQRLASLRHRLNRMSGGKRHGQKQRT